MTVVSSNILMKCQGFVEMLPYFARWSSVNYIQKQFGVKIYHDVAASPVNAQPFTILSDIKPCLHRQMKQQVAIPTYASPSRGMLVSCGKAPELRNMMDRAIAGAHAVQSNSTAPEHPTHAQKTKCSSYS